MDSSAIQMVNENDMDMFNASHLISGHQRPSLDCNDRDSASSSCIATYFSCFNDSLAEKVDLGGQSLPNGRPLAYASSSKIGRFEIISWAEYLGPLLQPRPTAWPDHLLLGSNLPVSRKISKPKSLSLKGIAPVPRKKLSVVKKQKKLSKHSLAEEVYGAQVKRKAGMQRGICDFMLRMDGPMGTGGLGNSVL